MFLPITNYRSPARKLDGRPVNLAFETLALRTLCECQSKAERELGIRAAARLRERLADIRAAEVVTDLVAGRPREIQGGLHRHYAVDLTKSHRLVFCANHNRIPAN